MMFTACVILSISVLLSVAKVKHYSFSVSLWFGCLTLSCFVCVHYKESTILKNLENV